MITEKDILTIVKACATKEFDHYYSYLKEVKFPDVASAIYRMLLEKVMDIRTENAELSAKVKAYEAIIENSNFKMAVVRKNNVVDKR
jgi:hypothetical protein